MRILQQQEIEISANVVNGGSHGWISDQHIVQDLSGAGSIQFMSIRISENGPTASANSDK